MKQSISHRNLQSCAVVNFRCDGDVVHSTPRAHQNTGAMAAHVRNFDYCFQIEKLSSRNFDFSNPVINMHGGANHMDISSGLVATADTGLGAPPPPQSRRQRLICALCMWRTTAAAAPKGMQAALRAVSTQSEPAVTHAESSLRRSVSARDLGCVLAQPPDGKDTASSAKVSSPVSIASLYDTFEVDMVLEPLTPEISAALDDFFDAHEARVVELVQDFK